MMKIYFGTWNSAEDMRAALVAGGVRESSWNPPFPLVEDQSTRVLFAASPETLHTGKPLILIQNGSGLYVQSRMDRWEPIYRVREDMRERTYRWKDVAASLGFAALMREIHRVMDVWPFVELVETRCPGCGAHEFGGRSCTSCNQVDRADSARMNPRPANNAKVAQLSPNSRAALVAALAGKQ